MASKALPALPFPPRTYTTLKPVSRYLNKDSRLFRIHRSENAALYFGQQASYRFDDEYQQFGVMYASEQLLGAFVETLLHDVQGAAPACSVAQMRSRKVTQFAVNKRLRLVDVGDAGAQALGLDARIWTCDYECSQAWSRWLYHHPSQFAGIAYRARHNAKYRCVALFDRAGQHLTTQRGVLLSSKDVQREIKQYAAKAHIDIVDDQWI